MGTFATSRLLATETRRATLFYPHHLTVMAPTTRSRVTGGSTSTKRHDADYVEAESFVEEVEEKGMYTPSRTFVATRLKNASLINLRS